MKITDISVSSELIPQTVKSKWCTFIYNFLTCCTKEETCFSVLSHWEIIVRADPKSRQVDLNGNIVSSEDAEIQNILIVSSLPSQIIRWYIYIVDRIYLYSRWNRKIFFPLILFIYQNRFDFCVWITATTMFCCDEHRVNTKGILTLVCFIG